MPFCPQLIDPERGSLPIRKQRRSPGRAPHPAGIPVANKGAALNLGSDLQRHHRLEHGVAGMIAALTKDLFLVNADRHYAKLTAYDEVPFRAANLEK